MKKTIYLKFPQYLSVFLLFAFTTAFGQHYVNGNLSTGVVSKSGVVAPEGYTWSELQNNEAGTITNVQDAFDVGNTFKHKMADDFVVPTDQIWNLNNFEFYVFADHELFVTEVPVTALGIEIWDADPSIATSHKIYGSLTVNVLDFSHSGEAFMYAIKNSSFITNGDDAPHLGNKIWKIRGNVNATLAAGKYWVVFQPVNPYESRDVQVPLNKVIGSRGYPQNSPGKFRDGSPGNDWVPSIRDGGFPGQNFVFQDYPFTINYTLALGTNKVANKANIKIFPNPVKENLVVEWDNLINANIEYLTITDIRGAKVIETRIKNNFSTGNSVKIDLSQLRTGLYFVALRDNQNTLIYSDKIVKQ